MNDELAGNFAGAGLQPVPFCRIPVGERRDAARHVSTACTGWHGLQARASEKPAPAKILFSNYILLFNQKSVILFAVLQISKK
jgi:hypothetical protein